MTKDFVDILEAISESEFYTEDPSEACIFIPPFNILNEAHLDPISSSKSLTKMENGRIRPNAAVAQATLRMGCV